MKEGAGNIAGYVLKALFSAARRFAVKRLLLVAGCWLICILSGKAQTAQYTTPGTYTFTVPAGVTTITVQCWGGGGGGGSNGNSAAGGGGGGAYTRGVLTSLIPGSTITVTVGVGGTVGVNGGISSVSGIIANGGSSTNSSRNGGAGGIASAIGGYVIASYAGGSGGNARVSSGGQDNEGGGGGGGSATAIGPGGNGGNGTATTGGSGGIGTGNGGRGADADGSPDAALGLAPGGGGGGRGEGASTSKAGAGGQVILSWTCPPFSISGNLNVCVGSTTQLTCSGTPAAVNPWISANTAVATINNTGLVTGITAGTSLITYTDFYGCSYTATVTVNPLPTVNANPSSQTICSGASITPIIITNPNGIPGTTFSWTRTNYGDIIGIPDGTGSTISGTLTNITFPPATTTVTFFVQAHDGSCSSNFAFPQVIVNTTQAPTNASAGPDQTGTSMCGLTSTTLAANSPVYGTGQWAIVSGSGGTIANPLSSTSTFTGSPGVAYVLRWTISNGICTDSYDEVNITFNQNPTLNVTNPSPVCLPSTIDLTAPAVTAGSTPGLGYTYWIDAAATMPLASPASVSNSGTYYIRGATSGGCYVIQPVTVTVNPTSVISNQEQALCGNGTFSVIPVNGSGNIVPPGTTYSWPIPVSNPLGAITGGSAQSGQNSISQTLTNNTANPATLTYTVTPVSGSCTGSSFTVTVTISQLPVVSGPATAYAGPTDYVYTTVTGQAPYTWSISPGGVITSGQNTNQIHVTWNSAGPQSVTVITNCGTTAPYLVNVLPPVVVNFQIVKSQSSTSTAPGGLVTYTISYQNTGVNTATNVVITDNLPPASLFTYVSSSNSGSYNAGVPSVIWNIGNVAPNESGFVTVTGYWGILGSSYSYNPTSYYTSAGSSTNTITNSARITCAETPAGNSANPVSTTVPQFCGSVFPDGNNSFRQGEDKMVYFPINIVNTGNIYDNFILTVPPYVTATVGVNRLYLRILDNNGNPINQTGWIPPGSSFTFLLELDGTRSTYKPQNGDIFNIVISSTSTVCGTVSTSTLTTETYNGHPLGQQNLQVNKTASTSSYSVGSGPVTYTIIVTNVGQSPATGFTLTDVVPANVPPPLPGDIVPAGILAGNTITWPTIPIDAGQSFTYRVTIYPSCLSIPSLVNTAQVTLLPASGEVDIDLANNSSSVTIPVVFSHVTPNLSTSTPIICTNGSAVLNATGAVGGETYRWYNVPTGPPVLATGSSYTTPGLLSDQTYYASIYDPATQCESARSSIAITVNPAPAAAGAITGTASVCGGQNNVSYSVPVIPYANNYIWSYSGTGATITGSGNNIFISFSPTATSGTLSVYGQNSCGNGTASNLAITVSSVSTITLTSLPGTDNQTVCLNTLLTNITYATTGATGATFSGLPPGVAGSWAANVVTISGSPNTITGSPFTYTVTLTGCGNTTTTGTITINPLPTTSPIYHR